MQSRKISAVVVVALVAVAVVLFVVLRDDDGDNEQAATTPATTTTDTAPQREKERRPKPEVTTIVVRGGEPVGGLQELEYTRGDEVRFDVEADLAEEVHVHGYDIFEDVAPGKVARFDFPADIEGGFEVELESSHTQIAELTVEPG